MRIGDILITPEVVEKILFKHGVRPSEVECVLREEYDKTYFEKVKENRYMALGRCLRGYITIFFDRSVRTMEVVSARFSSTVEKRKYKKKMR